MTTKKMEIEPANVKRDRSGPVTQHYFVRLPKGMTNQDTNDPAIWRRVQADRNKLLRRHDTVYLVGYEEDFAISAVVVDATRDAAVLGGMKLIQFAERTTPLFNDGTYRVRWAGTGYAVERVSDGVQMGQMQGSEALAIRHIQGLYPRPAA